LHVGEASECYFNDKTLKGTQAGMTFVMFVGPALDGVANFSLAFFLLTAFTLDSACPSKSSQARVKIWSTPSSGAVSSSAWSRRSG
jgi:hypothetical protein